MIPCLFFWRNMAQMRIPYSYKTCRSKLDKGRRMDSKAVSFNTHVERSKFSIDGNTLPCFWIVYHSSRIVCFFPDESVQVFTRGYKTKSTLIRINAALFGSGWCLYAHKKVLHWRNLVSDVYPFNEGDRVYNFKVQELVNNRAIYGNIEEIGFNTLVALQLLRM